MHWTRLTVGLLLLLGALAAMVISAVRVFTFAGPLGLPYLLHPWLAGAAAVALTVRPHWSALAAGQLLAVPALVAVGALIGGPWGWWAEPILLYPVMVGLGGGLCVAGALRARSRVWAGTCAATATVAVLALLAATPWLLSFQSYET